MMTGGSSKKFPVMPQLSARIDRRLLINYRVDPEVLTPMLPEGLRLQLVDGSAVAGVCMIRLTHARPRALPAAVGVRAENAAHRIAVQWDDSSGSVRSGVYVPRRQSNSVIPVLLGGRLFPGVHTRAQFDVQETGDRISVAMRGAESVQAHVSVGGGWSSTLFADFNQASKFFQCGTVGWSPRADGQLDSMQLDIDAWSVLPGTMHTLQSSFFAALPSGSAEFDNVLIMRGVESRWRAA